MNIRESNPGLRRARAAGFTLVEIAISMAIIAFALSIIISILPSSLRVQRDVREESLVMADGQYVMEALQRGARGVDSLMPSVDQLTTNGVVVPMADLDGYNLIRLLTTPYTNVNALVMRSLSGAMTTQGGRNTNVALRYQVSAQVIPVDAAGINPELMWTNQLATNLYEIRLTFRWPVLPAPGFPLAGSSSRKVFRTLVGGSINPGTGLLDPNHFLKP